MANLERTKTDIPSKKGIKIGESKSKIKDSYERTYGESPIFNLSNNLPIAPVTSYLFDFHTDYKESEKYGAMNTLRVTNSSAVTLLIYPNQGKKAIAIPPSTSVSLDRKVIPAIRSLRVYNSDATTTIDAELIRIEFWKEGIVLDSVVGNIHKLIIRGLFVNKSGQY